MFAVLCFVKIITFHCIWGGGGGFVVKYLLVAEFQCALIWQKQVDTEEEEEKEDSPATKDTVSSDFTFKFTFTANDKRQIQVENFSE